MSKRELVVIAIDPGDVHVGFAWRRKGKIESRELAAETAPDFINRALMVIQGSGSEAVLVIENFVLYPSKAGAQSWSPMLTSEMIGALKWIASRLSVQVVMQGADIKIPTRRQLKARGIKATGDAGGHADDALLHLYYYLLRNDLLEN